MNQRGKSFLNEKTWYPIQYDLCELILDDT